MCKFLAVVLVAVLFSGGVCVVIKGGCVVSKGLYEIVFAALHSSPEQQLISTGLLLKWLRLFNFPYNKTFLNHLNFLNYYLI